MSVKEELLVSTAEILSMERGVTWGLVGSTPYSHWSAPDDEFRLSDVSIWKPGVKDYIDSVLISVPAEEVTLKVTRANTPEADLENDFINDYFLRPLKDFLTHEHQVCMNGLIARIYDQAHKENTLFDKERKFPKGFRVTYR